MRLRSALAMMLLAGVLTAFMPDEASAGQPNPTPSPSASHTHSGGNGSADVSGQWPLTSLDAAALWERTRGAGVRIAVVDTGIDSAIPDLRSVVVESRDLLGGHPSPAASSSHGTDVAELIAGKGLAGPTGLAPAASVIDIRVAASLRMVTAAAIAAGIVAAADAGAQIINVSVGVPRDSVMLRAAVSTAESKGCLVVASAGGSASALYPAAIAGVLSVGAEDQDHNRAAAPPDTVLFAPGTGLFPNALGGGGDALKGSDFAAAYVSAAAALVLSASRRLTPSVVGSDLAKAAGASKLLDPAEALQLASLPAPVPPPSRPQKHHAKPTRPAPRSTPVQTYLLGAIVVLIILFAGYLVFLARRTRGTGISVSAPASASPRRPPGDDRARLPADYEPSLWDQSW